MKETGGDRGRVTSSDERCGGAVSKTKAASTLLAGSGIERERGRTNLPMPGPATATWQQAALQDELEKAGPADELEPFFLQQHFP